MTTTVVALFFLLACSAFFSATETAMMSLGVVKAHILAEQGDHRAKRVQALLNNPNRLLTTLLIGNNIVNIAASVIATALAISWWGPKGTGIAAIIMTVLVLLFGEIIPKSYAVHFTEKIALATAKPVHFLSVVLLPLISVFTWLSDVFLHLFGSQERTSLVTAEEIRSMVSLGHQEGVLEEAEGEIIHNVFKFADTTAEDIMTPRLDLPAIHIDATVDEAAQMMVKYNTDHLAAYQEDRSAIIGVIHIEDILAAKISASTQTVRHLMREAFLVPETKPVDDLFAQMRKERISSAIVADEYGSTTGMVTLDDLVENIVGDLHDEHDVDQDEPVVAMDGDTILNGRLAIDEVNELLETALPSDYVSTLGGWIFHTFGRLPEPGDTITYDDWEYQVVSMDRWRVDKVRARKSSIGTS